MHCLQCGTENRGTAKFCDKCGAQLSPQCASCGAENRRDASFRGECGAALEALVGTEVSPEPARLSSPSGGI
ncbi:MAG: zinc-ribbon domain-containing protein [Stellaceae bacterium]